MDEVTIKIIVLFEADYCFNHLIADGLGRYEGHKEYQNLNPNQITKLKIIAKTEGEFLNDVLLSADDYLKRVNPD